MQRVENARKEAAKDKRRARDKARKLAHAAEIARKVHGSSEKFWRGMRERQERNQRLRAEARAMIEQWNASSGGRS
jgi:vacuolar-type H+-ATPase subunit H